VLRVSQKFIISLLARLSPSAYIRLTVTYVEEL
jgi:hypothetical protein